MRTLILLLTLSRIAAASPVADFTSALEQAKAANKPIAVLVHGSDWNPPGEVLMKSWNSDAFKQSAGNGMVLVAVDRKESPAGEDQAVVKRNESCSLPYRGIPALGLYDPEGRLVACLSGTAEIRGAGGLQAAVKSMALALAERDALWKRAQAATGQDKAVFLGRGLDRMNQGLGHKNCYMPVLEEIRKADPADKSGYAGKYTFSSWSLLGMVMDKAGRNQQAEAEKELAGWIHNTRLTAEQRQQLHAARFALYQRWPEKNALSRKALEDMRNANPKSELGIAAAHYLQQLKDS